MSELDGVKLNLSTKEKLENPKFIKLRKYNSINYGHICKIIDNNEKI